jgi:hypothetical protein
MAEVLKSQGGFILFSARSRGQVLKMASIQGDVVARTRLDASWDNIRPFLFFARPSCEMLYFEMFYLMTPRSESSMNLMSIVTSSLKSASALSFSRACVVLSLEFNSSL